MNLSQSLLTYLGPIHVLKKIPAENEDGPMHQKAVLPFSVTWIGWKAGQRGT